MKLFLHILTLVLYVQSFAAYALKDYSCCGHHTRKEVIKEEKKSCCAHAKSACAKDEVSTPKKSSEEKSCCGDFCKCVSCHSHISFLPQPGNQLHHEGQRPTGRNEKAGNRNLHGNDFINAMFQPPKTA
ncbi:MAG: hypothetical protein IPN29_17025 [Saprospiraceae bacterium]|nr:hypothetical protein [Saprospiraceae bacterium]